MAPAVTVKPTEGPLRRLVVADQLLRDPELIDEGVWPRACTWLIRLALEHAIDDYWKKHRPEVVEVSRRAQLLALSQTVDAELGRSSAQLWYALNRAAHHHAYELAPTVAESEDVQRNPRYRKPRELRVPVEVDPSGTAFMGAHFKIAQSATISPRVHYLDATARTKVVYVGYIGAHLPLSTS